MKDWMNRAFILIMTVVFTAAILRVSSSSLLSAEEELIENIVKASKVKDNPAINFFDIFEGESCFILDACKNCHFTNRNNSLNYQDPLIDIPLMPPELNA